MVKMGQLDAPPSFRNSTTADDGNSIYTQDDGTSLYTQQSEDEMNDTPPAYSDASGSASEPLLLRPVHRETRKHGDVRPFKQYDELEMIMDSRFDSDPVYAEDMVREWCTIPAQQMIRIRGTHNDESRGAMKNEKTVVDFDVQVPLVDYITNHSGGNAWSQLQIAGNDEKVYRGGVLKSKGPVMKKGPDTEALLTEHPRLSLTAWMHLFCASHAQLKSYVPLLLYLCPIRSGNHPQSTASLTPDDHLVLTLDHSFRIDRTVSGLDKKYLENALRSLVTSTNYRGRTQITFPITNGATELHSTHRLNAWRFNQWICLIFYMTFMWMISWPYLFFATRKWAVVSVDWPWSVQDEYGVKTYASISEGEWFRKWERVIEKAICAKQQGTLTMHDLIRSELPPPPFNSGSAAVDRVVGVFGASIRGARELRRQWGWGGDR